MSRGDHAFGCCQEPTIDAFDIRSPGSAPAAPHDLDVPVPNAPALNAQILASARFVADPFEEEPDLLAGRRDHSELADDTMSELRLLAEGVARVVPSLCGVLLTVTAAGVDSTIRLAVGGDGSKPVRSSLQLPLSVGTSGGVVVFQASTPQAFDELGRDAVVLLPDGGLGVVLDRHLSRTTAALSTGDPASTGPADPAGDLASALADASMVNQALGALLGQGFLPVDASTELDRRASQAGLSRVAAAIDVLDALTSGRRKREGRRPAPAPQGADPNPS